MYIINVIYNVIRYNKLNKKEYIRAHTYIEMTQGDPEKNRLLLPALSVLLHISSNFS